MDNFEVVIERIKSVIGATTQKNVALDLGYETGPGARPAKAGWFMDVIEQCRAANVPVWVKKAPPRVPVIREMPCPNN
jgi:protein gp37